MASFLLEKERINQMNFACFKLALHEKELIVNYIDGSRKGTFIRFDAATK